jgi:hypothetical protein
VYFLDAIDVNALGDRSEEALAPFDVHSAATGVRDDELAPRAMSSRST